MGMSLCRACRTEADLLAVLNYRFSLRKDLNMHQLTTSEVCPAYPSVRNEAVLTSRESTLVKRLHLTRDS
jgi:hypothetical protein